MKPRRKEHGEGMVSHLIILVLVVLVCITAAGALGGAIISALGYAAGEVGRISNG